MNENFEKILQALRRLKAFEGTEVPSSLEIQAISRTAWAISACEHAISAKRK